MLISRSHTVVSLYPDLVIDGTAVQMVSLLKMKKERKMFIFKHTCNLHNINPLTPRRTLVSPFTEISILF